MSLPLPLVYLARHGETAWSLTGQHTGTTDLPLTDNGVLNAQRLGKLLDGVPFASVLCSPLLRARQTCEAAGFAARAALDPDLVEWNYGEYEGVRTHEIHAERPDWLLFRDGCPGGESPDEVTTRADRVVARIRRAKGNSLVFSSGHFLRVLAARWLGLDPIDGKYFVLSTASLSVLGYEHDLDEPVIRLWNDDDHVVSPAMQH